ncbi:MAG: hypothetical protein OEZ43_09895 [Gammaproteobacteria bacterium]|nr:hypothetical protein [Gammaproteobacteria bacterium]
MVDQQLISTSLQEPDQDDSARNFLTSYLLSHSSKEPPHWYQRINQCLEELGTDQLNFRACLREHFSQCYKCGDVEGAYNCWSLMVDACREGWIDQGELSEWLGKLDELRERYPVFPSLPTAANVTVARFALVSILRSENAAELQPLAKTCEFLITQSRNPYFKRRARHYLSQYYLTRGNQLKVDELNSQSERRKETMLVYG